MVFLNEVLFIVLNHPTTSNLYTELHRIDMSVSGGSLTASATLIDTFESGISELAVFEMTGFVYTVSGEQGYHLLKLDKETQTTVLSDEIFGDGVEWKLY